jgi:osmotically-inducible protein OsmY
MWNDTDLQYHVEKELGWEPGVHTTQIGVIAKDGAIQLVGHVDTFWEKCVAERAAWRVAHVRSVKNELRVELPFDALRADDDIALAAMGNLEWNCLVPETVEVQVVDAWVTLMGEVGCQYQKEEAERALCPLKGIKGIRNEILVRPNVRPGDVRSLIEDALKRNALINAGHIKAHVANGIATLHGSVHSRAEHDEAMHAAWAAPGITNVEDHITVGTGRDGKL